MKSFQGIKFVRSEEKLQEPLLQPLFEDLVECEELLIHSDTQFARRTFVRASFAFIEAKLFWYKRVVEKLVLISGEETRRLPLSTLALLQEETFRPNKQGKLEPEANRMPFLNYCAFVLRTAAESSNLNADLLFSDNGWANMQTAVAVRHRITHPKQIKDCDVTDAEMLSVREAHRWLLNFLVEVANALPLITKP